jgi:hypothetical protein
MGLEACQGVAASLGIGHGPEVHAGLEADRRMPLIHYMVLHIVNKLELKIPRRRQTSASQ